MSTSISFCFLFLLSLLATLALAQVPTSKQFKISINDTEVGQYISEYDASYRIISGPDFFTFPFQMLFYNTSPDAYILSLRMGIRRVESKMYWIWDANRNNPVGEHGTLTFGRDGNLVIANGNGRVAWQTNTANKGVTGYSILQSGNFVLHDSKGKFLWQSFDHPTDTFLVGQTLRTSGPNKIVSRTSDTNSFDGPYSVVIEPSGFHMYMNHMGKRLQYGGWGSGYGPMKSITLVSEPEDGNAHAFDLLLRYEVSNISQTGRKLKQTRKAGGPGFINLARPNYNATYSILRLGSDGNLKVFTYYDKVDLMAWEETFAFFSPNFIRECALPAKCGSLGLCERGMCVGCPQPGGLLGWSDKCRPPKIPTCKSKSNANVDYYKVVGAEHFLNQYEEGVGPLKVEECRERCSKDCNCVGFSYWGENSKCWLVPVLNTLIKVTKSSRVVYIKFSK